MGVISVFTGTHGVDEGTSPTCWGVVGMPMGMCGMKIWVLLSLLFVGDEFSLWMAIRRSHIVLVVRVEDCTRSDLLLGLRGDCPNVLSWIAVMVQHSSTLVKDCFVTAAESISVLVVVVIFNNGEGGFTVGAWGG
jgi:hypothetical protein